MIRLITGVLLAAAVWAQNAETLPFRAVLNAPGNPAPVGGAPTSTATVLIHSLRGNTGQVASATVEVRVNLASAQAGVTNVRIREGAVGSNGAIVVETTGAEGQVAFVEGDPGTAMRLQALRGILANPGRYHVDVQASGSSLQGPLHAAQKVVLSSIMRPENEVPAQLTQPNAFAVGSIIAYATRDASGALSSGEVFFDVNYDLNRAANITGLHIHSGPAGVAAPVTIGTPISAANPVVVPARGIGNIRSRVEVNLSNAASRDALEGLFTHPADYYVNLHTAELPAGIVRAQLRNTDKTTIESILTSTTPGALPAISSLTIYTLRAVDAAVQAGVVEFNVATRVSASTQFTGLGLQTGLPGQMRPSIGSGISPTNPVQLEPGVGLISRFVTVSSLMETGDLDILLTSPELFTLTLTPAAGASAAVSGPLGLPNTAPPQAAAVISAVSDPQLTTIAPGGLATIHGINFSKLTQDLLAVEGHRIPWSLSGIGVSVDGIRAPLLMISPTFAVFQVPFEVTAGTKPVSVITNRGVSAPVTATVAAVAPALYFGPEGGTAIHLDYSLVSAQRPAEPNELVWLYATGLGQTVRGEMLETGMIPEYRNGTSTASVTATVGGSAAEVLSSIPSPGYVGLYQVLIRIPANASSGNQPVSIGMAGASSNTVTVRIK